MIKALTWKKETADLFDYESVDDVNNYETSLCSDGYILRSEHNIKVIKGNAYDGIDNKVISYMDCNINDYFYMSEDYNLNGSTGEQSWINMKCLKNNKYLSGYILHQGDIIKFGRIKLKVRDICMNGKQTCALSGMGMNSKKIAISTQLLSINDKENLIKKKICRVCYCDEQEIESPLITPCKCSGGLKYIHFSCLQQWLKTRAIFNQAHSNENCIIYQTNQANCEICQSTFPDFLRERNNLYEIFDFIECTFNNYISFESIPKDQNENKKIFLLGFDNKNIITVGRSHETDLRITDISVSRLHAKIIINKDNSLLLQDFNSKFGTLVLLQHPRLRILPLSPLSLQIGRTLLILSIKRELCICNLWSKTDHIADDYGTANASKIALEKILVIQDHEMSHHNKSETSDMENYDRQQQHLQEERLKINDDNKNSERSVHLSSRKLILKSNNIFVMGVKTTRTLDCDHENATEQHGRNEEIIIMPCVNEVISEEVGYKVRNENNCSFNNLYDKDKETMKMNENQPKKRRSFCVEKMTLNVRKYFRNIHDVNVNNNTTTMKDEKRIFVMPISPINKNNNQ